MSRSVGHEHHKVSAPGADALVKVHGGDAATEAIRHGGRTGGNASDCLKVHVRRQINRADLNRCGRRVPCIPDVELNAFRGRSSERRRRPNRSWRAKGHDVTLAFGDCALPGKAKLHESIVKAAIHARVSDRTLDADECDAGRDHDQGHDNHHFEQAESPRQPGLSRRTSASWL